MLRRVVRGVYVAAQVEDRLEVRAGGLALVMPEHMVVTDRTAGWLHGAPVLQRGAHLVVPPLDLCSIEASRMRRPETRGGVRMLHPEDVQVIFGLQVTTPLRTALDPGRRLWRLDAIAAFDGFVRLGLDHELLLSEIEQFKGYRGVVQLRELAPLADGRAESPGESALRLHWLDAGLPNPELQVWVSAGWGVGPMA